MGENDKTKIGLQELLVVAPPMKSARADALCGQTIDGRYEVLSVLGAGGMGKVYKARNVHFASDVALKVLTEGFSADDNRRQRFEMEAKAAHNLTHPNVVSVLDYGFTTENHPYFVMQLVDGKPLSDLLKETGKLSAQDAYPIFLQMCDALSYIHKNQIIHRDLKPANVMLTKDAAGELCVRIVDFGIAKSITQEQRLTATGEVFGSPFYMSPEQQLGQTVDQRSDLYSLGCLMYECLSGDVPYKGDAPMQTFLKHLNEDAAPIGASIPSALENVVFRCLEKKPEQRYQSADDVKAALLAAQQDPNVSTINKVTTGVTRRIRRMPLWKKLTICLLGLSGVAAYFYLPIDDERADRVARLMCLTPAYSAPNNSTVVHCNIEAAKQAQQKHFATARTYYGQGARIAAGLPFAKSSVKAIMGYKKMQARVEYNLLLKTGTKPKALPDHLAFYSILQQIKQLRGADNHSKTLQLQRGLAQETANLGKSSLPLENQYELVEVETILGDIATDISMMINSKADLRDAITHYERALEIAKEHQGDVPPNDITALESKLILCKQKLGAK